MKTRIKASEAAFISLVMSTPINDRKALIEKYSNKLSEFTLNKVKGLKNSEEICQKKIKSQL